MNARNLDRREERAGSKERILTSSAASFAIIERTDGTEFRVTSSDMLDIDRLIDKPEESAEILEQAKAQRVEGDPSNCTAEDDIKAAQFLNQVAEFMRSDDLLLTRSYWFANGTGTNTDLLLDIIADMKNQGPISYYGCLANVKRIEEEITTHKVRQQVIKGEFRVNMTVFGGVVARKLDELQNIFYELQGLRFKYESENPGTKETAAKIQAKYREFLELYGQLNQYNLPPVNIYNQTYDFSEFNTKLPELRQSAEILANLPTDRFEERYRELNLPRPALSSFSYNTLLSAYGDTDWPAIVITKEVEKAISDISKQSGSDGFWPPRPFRVFVDPDKLLGAKSGTYRSIHHAYGAAVEFVVHAKWKPNDQFAVFQPNEEDWNRALAIVKTLSPTYIAPMDSPSRLYVDWRDKIASIDDLGDIAKLSNDERQKNMV